MARSADRKSSLKKTSKAIAFQTLEQRLLLDGAAVATMVDAVLVDDIQSEIELAAVTAPKDDSAAARDHKAHVGEFDGLGLAGNDRNEVVFIDGSVPNAGELLSNISPAADVYFIDTASDGVSQIADILQNYSNVDSLHIVSHGDQGSLALGIGTLNQSSMQSTYGEQLALIGDALSDHGDILIYGCDFASGSAGAVAAGLLADLTGADIAASTDDTGSDVKGGDWDLEHQTGNVESRTIQALGFNGILADLDGDDVDDDNDGILDTVELTHVDAVTLAQTGNQSLTVGTPMAAFSGGGVDAELTVISGNPTRLSFCNDVADVNNAPPGAGFQYVGSVPDATFELDLSSPVTNLVFTIGDMEGSNETAVIRAYDENNNLLPDSALSFLISADATDVSILAPNSVGTSVTTNSNIDFDNDAGTVHDSQ